MRKYEEKVEKNGRGDDGEAINGGKGRERKRSDNMIRDEEFD
jgi:hypothetical protein